MNLLEIVCWISPIRVWLSGSSLSTVSKCSWWSLFWERDDTFFFIYRIKEMRLSFEPVDYNLLLLSLNTETKQISIDSIASFHSTPWKLLLSFYFIYRMGGGGVGYTSTHTSFAWRQWCNATVITRCTHFLLENNDTETTCTSNQSAHFFFSLSLFLLLLCALWTVPYSLVLTSMVVCRAALFRLPNRFFPFFSNGISHRMWKGWTRVCGHFSTVTFHGAWTRCRSTSFQTWIK